MTNIEKMIFGFLVLFFLIGAAVRAYRYQNQKIKLEVVHVENNQNLTKQIPFSSKKKSKKYKTSHKKQIFKAIDKKNIIISLNNSNEEDWISLPGIGKVMAQRIIQYRTENGPFKEKTDLLNVKGFRIPLYKKIESYLIVSK